MKLRFATAVLVSMLAVMPAAVDAARAVVLVTGTGCDMQAISILEVRKAYFGFDVSYQGRSVRAYRISNDKLLDQVFFQSVVAMSERTYERRLLLQLMKYGRPRPQELQSVEDAVAAVNRFRCGIAYIWQTDLESHSSIKAIKTLWQEN